MSTVDVMNGLVLKSRNYSFNEKEFEELLFNHKKLVIEELAKNPGSIEGFKEGFLKQHVPGYSDYLIKSTEVGKTLEKLTVNFEKTKKQIVDSTIRKLLENPEQFAGFKEKFIDRHVNGDGQKKK